MQREEVPFSFNLMPLADNVAIERGGQHLSVSLPQPVNYSNLVIHSNTFTQPSAPVQFHQVPESIQYNDVIGRELKREETKANIAFNKHYNNRIHPIAVKPYDQTGPLNKSVNSKINESRTFNKLKAIIGSVITILVIIILVVIIIFTMGNKSSNNINISTNTNSSYTIQTSVLCTTTTCGCTYNPCLNGGICKMITTVSYACSCPLYFSGSNCQNYYNPCNSNPCQNGGVCTSSTGSSFTCTCSSGYSGVYCQSYNPCYNNQCKNGGTCQAVGSNYVCLCPYFYSGTYCQVFIMG